MRAIPDNNLCYPVAITLANGGFGSGFFLNGPTTIYLVTAKHVLYDDSGKLHDTNATGIAIAKDLKTRISINIDLQKLETDANLKPHASADVVVVKLGELRNKTLQLVPGCVVSGETPSSGGIMGARIAACYKFNDVFVSNDVFVFGYPISLGEKGQLDPDRPLLRKGIVADKDPTKQHIVIDCAVYQGNSGGLVMEVREVSLGSFEAHPIGVATSFVPFVEKLKNLHYGMINTRYENSGYAIVTPMDRVLELI